uniref:Uncharacterized protein n=1 Tax=Triticum urartu TaxID=4572 RepID=A0A8R7K336_TRIUA
MILDRAQESWWVWRSRGGWEGEMLGRSVQVMVEWSRPSLPTVAFRSSCPIPNLGCTSIFLLYFSCPLISTWFFDNLILISQFIFFF